ncbi:MAG: sensor histidine kinase [Saprospiraceae bacterium]|nr:sensor histidine kinase [Saprospiraceae bacterium]
MVGIGNIQIQATYPNDKTKSQLQIHVSDTGIGIQEDQLPFVFDRYYRVDDMGEHDGFGIGLSLVNNQLQ